MPYLGLVREYVAALRKKRLGLVNDAVGMFRGYVIACDREIYVALLSELRKEQKVATAVWWGYKQVAKPVIIGGVQFPDLEIVEDRGVIDAVFIPRLKIFVACYQ